MLPSQTQDNIVVHTAVRLENAAPVGPKNSSGACNNENRGFVCLITQKEGQTVSFFVFLHPPSAVPASFVTAKGFQPSQTKRK